MPRTLTLSEQTIERIRSIRDSPAEYAALTAAGRCVIDDLVEATRPRALHPCEECGRDAGHTVDCSQHWSKSPLPACPGCKHGNYGTGSEHTCGVW